MMQVEAVGVVARMHERECMAHADRVLLSSFLAIRTLSDPPVRCKKLQSVVTEPIHLHKLDVVMAARLPAGGPVWRELRARLMADASATVEGRNG